MKELDIADQEVTVKDSRAHRLLLSMLLFVACPGDDIMAGIGALSNIGRESTTMSVEFSPEKVLGIYWAHQRLEQDFDAENEKLLEEEIEV